jgi:hypothetical protein
MGILVGIYPCPGDEEGLSKKRSLRISVVGWMKRLAGWKLPLVYVAIR